MCGISGVFTFKRPVFQLTKKITNFVDQATYVGSLRGRDATGIMGVMRDNPAEIVTAKRAIDGSMFGDTYTYQNIVKDVDDYAVTVIHNRKGTLGGNTDGMAHPFVEGHITLVHNGTLYNHTKLGGGNKCASDSQAIAYALMCAQDPKDVLEDLDGAFTLIWHNAIDQTMNIARNEQRPLSVGFNESHNNEVMLFCSESGMLTWLADRCDLPIKETMSPTVGTLYTWQLTGENVGVRNWNETAFVPLADEWDKYYQNGGYGRGKAVTGQKSSSTAITAPATSTKYPVSARHERELYVESKGITMGTNIDFVVYNVSLPANPALGAMAKVEGIDPEGGYECSAYVIWDSANQSQFADLQGCLCRGYAHTVINTSSYKDWPIIDVKHMRIIERGYWAKGKDYVQPDNEWVAPSAYCKSHKIDQLKCSEKCASCEKAERGAELAEAFSGVVDGDTVEDFYQVGYGRMGTMKQYEVAVKYGCSNCACDLLIPSETQWTRDDAPLCEDCAEDFYSAVHSCMVGV